jgi:hypothetical protein
MSSSFALLFTGENDTGPLRFMAGKTSEMAGADEASRPSALSRIRRAIQTTAVVPARPTG